MSFSVFPFFVDKVVNVVFWCYGSESKRFHFILGRHSLLKRNKEQFLLLTGLKIPECIAAKALQKSIAITVSFACFHIFLNATSTSTFSGGLKSILGDVVNH